MTNRLKGAGIRLFASLVLGPLAAPGLAGQAASRFVAESTAIARTMVDLAAEDAAQLQAGVDRARSLLNQPVVFAPGSTALSDSARLVLNAKAWYLYNNAALSLRLTGRADSAVSADAALVQSRARVDSVRRYLVGRGVDIERIGVEGGDSAVPPGEYGRVTFAVLGEATIVDVPPATAAPPPLERVQRLDGTFATVRHRWGTVRVFYATDRRRGDGGRPQSFYDGERSTTGTLELGRIEVTVPRVHRPGFVERPAWYRLDRSTSPDRHFEVRSIQPLSSAAAYDSLRSTVRRSQQREALVLIHGYNVSFYDAALRAAQLTYDISFDGAPVLYSWPSRGSFFHYSADREAAEWSADHLRVFLDSLTAITGARRVHVVAHSMGNRVLTLALERMATPRRDTLFSNVVLAAADVDAARFQQQIAATIRPLASRLTIYQSGKDKALWASRVLSDHTRLGEATDPMLVMREVDTIDVTRLSTGLLGHGYIASNESLIEDLIELIGQKRGPPRKKTERVDVAAGTFWRLK